MGNSIKRILGLVLAASVLLAACSGGGSQPSGQTGADTQPGSDKQAPATERVIQTIKGEVKVPANPQRVVVLDTGELDSAIALGVKPVGAVTVYADGTFPAYLADKTEGITTVGTGAQPNLETIASLNPDLILSSDLRHKELYDKLSQIAPTVFTTEVGFTWKENLKVHAEALNKTAEAQQLMAAYDQRMADFKTKFGDKVGQTKVSILRGLSDHVRMYAKRNFIGTIIADAGFARVPSQDKDVFMEKATEERFTDMDGDIIIVSQFRPADGGETMMDKFMKQSMWQDLGGVKAGKVYEVPDDYWMIGIGIGAANKVVDDMFKLFIK